MKPELTTERLKELLSYSPETGMFLRVKTAGSRMAGEYAGYPDLHGYINIRVDNKMYKAHRLAWLYVYGQWPSQMIDHINRVKDDNRIANIRQATRSENVHNQGAKRISKTGIKGVFLSKSNRWIATLTVNGVRVSIGSFDTAEQATLARAVKVKELLGDEIDTTLLRVTDEMLLSGAHIPKRRRAPVAYARCSCYVCGVEFTRNIHQLRRSKNMDGRTLCGMKCVGALKSKTKAAQKGKA